MLPMFYTSVVAIVVLYATVCWGSWVKAVDGNRDFPWDLLYLILSETKHFPVISGHLVETVNVFYVTVN